EALQLLAAAPAEVVIAADIGLLAEVGRRAPHTQRLLLGDAAPAEVEQASTRGDIDRYLAAPWQPAQLRIALRSAMLQRRLDVDNERLHAELEERVETRTDQLARAKLEWERTFDAISDPMAILYRDRSVRRANRAYAAVGGRDIRAVPGLKCHQALFNRSEICPGCPLDDIDDEKTARARIQIGGHAYNVLAYPLGPGEAICSYRDISFESAMERQLAQSEKLNAAGQLAAGVAHEINNPLASILAFSQVMRAEPGRSAPDVEALKLIESSALRCKYIVEALLKFVRKPQKQRSPLDLRTVCEEAVALMRPQIKGLDVQLSLEPPAASSWVLANSNQLVQVLINLLQNAVHAVGTRGRIRVFWSRIGDRVGLSVSDDGPGIPPDIRDRIFEPFFTTKAEGVGTGLGLSITHRIVEEHGGTITVESVPGAGTTFTALFPPLEVP
ncbi:MAG TPA: ATP-binding protein, partial [Myxococcales bacterium]|nr:ATP-binding protein [Myxococcales bacterium]